MMFMCKTSKLPNTINLIVPTPYTDTVFFTTADRMMLLKDDTDDEDDEDRG